MEFKDYYQTLGVAKTASADEIRKAFRKLARKHHPDVSKAANATEQMAAVNEANAVLSDPEKRMAYDALAQGAAKQHSQSHGHDFQPPPNWDAGFEFSEHPSSGLHSDFFEQFFGRANAYRGQADFGGAMPDQTGGDHHAKLELDLTDAYSGCERSITLRSPSLQPHPAPQTVERTLQVSVPKGVYAGQRIRLAGHGGAGQGAHAAGDLLLEVVFKPDARWHAEGRDVFQTLAVSPWEAMLGASLPLQTPAGTLEVGIPAPWKQGRKLRLKGHGIPGNAAHPAGNLYVLLELALPPADNASSRAAYAHFASAFPGFNPRLPA